MHSKASHPYLRHRGPRIKHHAVKDANTKRSENLAATGIGGIDCILHNLQLVSAQLTDLQKGEKWKRHLLTFFLVTEFV